jgi:hypothetical protein
MKEFIHNHSWILPVVAAFAVVGFGILIGWLTTLGDDNTFVSVNSDDSDEDYSPSDEAIKWMNNPANPASPLWNNMNNP